MSSGTHAAPKTRRNEQETAPVQSRPMPSDAVSDAPTQIIPRVEDAQEQTPRLAAIPEAQLLRSTDHREAPAPPARGVAVGVPTPDAVFLDPSKIDFQTFVADWLADMAPRVQRKAEVYGSNSLAQMGRLFARGQGRESVPAVEALEIGSFVYAYGKMERVADAVLRGELPQIDTWNDLAIYALMCLYIRTVGRWP